MNEQEIKDLIALFEKHGWEPALCDTPVMLENNAIRAGLPVYKPILLDERNNGMIQGVVTEVTKKAPRVSQAMLSRRLGDAEKRMPSKKKLLKALSQTVDEGLWCSFLYQIYINMGLCL